MGAGGDDPFVGGDADVHVGGEAVGVKAGLRHGEPAAGVEQDGDGVGDLDELDAFYGAGVDGRDAGVGEGPGGGGAFGDGVGEGDADGVLRGEALGGEGVVLGVGDAGDVEAVVELEGGGVEIFKRGEGDLRGGGKGSCGGDEIGRNDVAADVELRARRGSEGCVGHGRGEERGGGGGKEAGSAGKAEGRRHEEVLGGEKVILHHVRR